MPRPKIAPPISGRQVNEYLRLKDLVEDTSFKLGLHGKSRPVEGIEAVLVRRLMADVARLMSREPGGRALLRLSATGALDPKSVEAALHDAEVALGAFRQAHWIADEDEESGGWNLVTDVPQTPLYL